jgi:tripartite-type tricarboxylate transporter receptor subunit TctC
MENMKSKLFKALVTLLALCSLLAVSASPVFAAASRYPSKPVRLIVPFAPGGVTDIIGRLMSAKLTERLGQQVIVENLGGAGGILGLERGAKAAPDGYTLCMVTLSYAFKPGLYAKLPYDASKSFSPIANLGTGMAGLAVHPSVPAKTVKEFIALAKQKPGQLIFVTAGVGSVSHLEAELFKDKADVDFKIVHFKGSGPGIVDLLGGHSHFTMTSTIALMPYIKSGQLRLLGTCGAKRSALLPDVPTVAEGGAPGFEARDWWGIVAPAGTPAPIIDRLDREIKSILATDEMKKRFMNDGAEVDYLGPAEFGPFIDKEITNWTRIIRKANIKLEE